MNIEEKATANINNILEKVTEKERKTILNLQKSKPFKTGKKPVEEEIAAVLFEIGMPEQNKGHRYSAYAIQVVIENPDIMDAVTTKLYPTVASKFNTTPSRVERAIRHGIECIFERGDCEAIAKYFGSTITPLRGRPTNAAFIACIANIVRSRVSNA